MGLPAGLARARATLHAHHSAPSPPRPRATRPLRPRPPQAPATTRVLEATLVGLQEAQARFGIDTPQAGASADAVGRALQWALAQLVAAYEGDVTFQVREGGAQAGGRTQAGAPVCACLGGALCACAGACQCSAPRARGPSAGGCL